MNRKLRTEIVPVFGFLGGRDGSLEDTSCRVASATVEDARKGHTELVKCLAKAQSRAALAPVFEPEPERVGVVLRRRLTWYRLLERRRQTDRGNYRPGLSIG